jgi:Zn-dependent peptidase ImmA (M78 family)
MQAITVRLGNQYVILIGRDSRFPAWIAFILAHELGHIVRGHIDDSAALLEMDDPLQVPERDNEELQADAFALALLTGDEEPKIIPGIERYSALQRKRGLIRAY